MRVKNSFLITRIFKLLFHIKNMVREDIVAGLKQAISKGESLRQAMMSFYKSGYIKEEIEEAARFIQNEQIQQRMAMTYEEVQEPTQTISQPQIQNTQIQTKQKISNYTEEKSSKLGWIILISGTLVIIILVILAIIFKNQITEFLNNLVG